MSAIDQLFQQLRSQGRKAFMPFITAGDPDLDFTADLLRTLVENGANLCEVGIPYSDPIADGPVIQASYTRALARQVKVSDILACLSRLAPTLPAPLVTMVSYAIIHRRGPRRFVDEARLANIAGAIVPDLLVEEAGPLAQICRQADFSLIQLVTPTTPRERALRIAEASSGFLYYVSVTGITGERTALPARLTDDVAWLRERTELPICIGFGINQPDQVRALAPIADGLIVGSAIVRRLADAATRPRAEVLAEIAEFARALVSPLGI